MTVIAARRAQRRLLTAFARYERARAERNAAVVAAVADGATAAELAELLGVTQQRISQIVNADKLTKIHTPNAPGPGPEQRPHR